MTKIKPTEQEMQEKEKKDFERGIVSAVKQDFENRRNERLKLERQWQLNINFLSGNQYCDINSRGEIVSRYDGFEWQSREVFNHVAPLVESRLARFSRINPVLGVRPKSDDQSMVEGALLSERLIASVSQSVGLKAVVQKVTAWSETCGSGFYKVVWDNGGGETLGVIDGAPVRSGGAKVLPVSPFEIFPDNLSAEDVNDCFSIIQARALPVREILAKYGKQVKGEEASFSLAQTDYDKIIKDAAKGVDGKGKSKPTEEYAIVVEKYERPSGEFPSGRLIAVAGDELLYYGDLPYAGESDGVFPFVKQDSVKGVGSFFGSSVIERLIPVQRAYNAVKNRKHEFINRLSMGVMTVEDGSVDIDDLREEGLSPGKILVYRQGAQLPQMMGGISMPQDFDGEEDKLINEFVIISGVADVSSSSANARVASGTALELLVEQDNERLILPAERIRESYVKIAKKVLKLYSEYAVGALPVRFNNKDGVKVTYLSQAPLQTEVYIENENELIYGEAKKRENLIKLYESGLLADENGVIRPSTKEKVLSLLGYYDLDYRKGISRLQEEKAASENEKIRKGGLAVECVDDHEIHVEEHTRYILSEYAELTDIEKQRLFKHVEEHKALINKAEKII